MEEQDGAQKTDPDPQDALGGAADSDNTEPSVSSDENPAPIGIDENVHMLLAPDSPTIAHDWLHRMTKRNENVCLLAEEFSNNTVSTSSDSGIHSRPSEKREEQADPDGDPGSRTSCSSATTLRESSDFESEDDNKVVKKIKPRQNWHLLPEYIQRQIGYSSKLSHPALFQQRCYGSLRNVQRLELMYKLEEHRGCVNSLNFSPDGKLLASGSDDLQFVIWDWSVGQGLLKVQTPHRRNIFQTKFLDLKGPGVHLATCARDGQVCYYQLGMEGTRKESRLLGQHRKPCHKLAVLKEQPHLVLSAGEDGLVLSHDLRSGGPPTQLVHVRDDDLDRALYSIHADPLRTHQFCVAGQESTVRVYDQRRCSVPVTALSPFKKSDPDYLESLHVTCAVYNHDGSEILASYNDNDVFLMDAAGAPGSFKHRYTGHRNRDTIKGVAFFGPRSEFVMSGSDCGHVFFWEKNSESIVQFLLADDNRVVNCLEPHPELPFLATSGLDWDVKVWVPSCEEEPAMPDLAETVKSNRKRPWSDDADHLDESQMLRLLLRRLRAAGRTTADPDDFSSDPSTSDSDTSDEDMVGCAAS
ncbi:DDB1- and CUL4-associated factor 8 [Cylas formicarius]|uniref:DDB1- and CUL4-associated factor 8 n=1 Tax=Cylas formicarius TaxID=197179 RepID=UPI00295896F4|nr:DDB1- and CUL4-associated factor 8 [Cylas formicarius]XP_060526253.1 DDB1- and CUL4-associated factor 8 [Cylas formicarius]XP_060526254.1 DDB1- and CUL4-associated factor 8 [Cylas formicarius]XP_060526255.1 DDB1- and CUL4-associated factor 8 [Cylas formicarius]